MDPELLMQLLSDPEMASALANMGVLPEQLDALKQPEGIGQHMLATPGAQGREVGRTYVASSPLEHLGVAVQRGLGAKKLADVNTQRQGLIQGDVGARKRYGAAMAEAMRRGRQPEPQWDPEKAASLAGFDDPQNYG